MKYFSIFISIIILFAADCKQNKEVELMKRSLRDDIDLFVVANKYNVMEGDWLMTRSPATFDKNDLISHLRTYGRTLGDLQNDPTLKYEEKDNTVQMEVAKTAHSSGYVYDLSIPIIFYGDKWFKKGEFSETVHQQNIAPTLAKILKTRNPNGSESSPITQILKQNYENQVPEIVVTITIDQGGQQLYRAHSDVPVNITSILKDSSYFPNAMVGHLDSHTAAGHAAIGTGAYPKKNGVIGNTYFRFRNGKVEKEEIYSKDEITVSPSELLSESLADVVDSSYGNESEVIAQANALRASIGTAGHGSAALESSTIKGDKDHVYWLSPLSAGWTTDERYYSLPGKTEGFGPVDWFNKEFPNGWKGIAIKEPGDVKKYWGLLMGTPVEARMEGELFRQTLQSVLIEKGKHKDGIPDLAYITFKSVDASGHQFGWESLEVKNTFREVDKQIGLIFELLKKEYGDKFVLIVTADHGCAPLPEISGGSRLLISTVFAEVNSLLPDPKSGESLINYMTIGQVSLNRELQTKYNISTKQIINKIMDIRVDNKKFFKKVYTREEILK